MVEWNQFSRGAVPSRNGQGITDPDFVVATARKYIGLPFVHQGRNLKSGLDCVGLLVQIAKDCQITHQDFRGYARAVNSAQLRKALELSCIEIKSSPEKGDILVFWIVDRMKPQHVGICAGNTFIHSENRKIGGGVREELYSEEWKKKTHSVWRFK